MTVTYTAEVATGQKFGCFLKLLFRWRGSIYKLVWMDLLLFLTLYYSINTLYIYGLEDESKRTFELVVHYCSSYGTLIPLSFVLGFYVSMVMQRWWEQYMTIPWPDSLAVYVSAHVHGNDEGSRVMRRTIMRYVCLCCTMMLTMISPCVKKRFPKLQHLVDAGLLQENEKVIIEAIDTAFPSHPKHWMPIVWAASIVARARKEGRIRDDYAVKTIIDALNSFRASCGTLMYYDFITVPLVYTQVVTIAVYSFFICSCLSHQWTELKANSSAALEFYCPISITLQFFFYMGWLKVAETLINPFGEDDDDFEVNWMIDRHLQVSYMIVDEMHHDHPDLVRDQYWDEVFPNQLPYDTDVKRNKPPEHSTAKFDKGHTTASIANPDAENVREGSVKGVLESTFSLLSERSEQFKQTFQRYSNISEDDFIMRKEKPYEVDINTPTTEIINDVTSFIISRIPSHSELNSSNQPATEEMQEEASGEQDGDEDVIESRSKSYLSGEELTNELFERLRLRRLQARYRRMNEYLERNFGPNFKIEYFDPMKKSTMPSTRNLYSNTSDSYIWYPARSTSRPTIRPPQPTIVMASRATSPMASAISLATPSSSEINFRSTTQS